MAIVDNLKMLAMMALAVNVALIVIALVAAIVIFFITKKQGVRALNMISSTIPQALESLSYSELPITVIAVIASYMQMPLKTLKEIYLDNAERRRALALETFEKDAVTDRFISSYDSKFIRHGYVGEELIS